MSLSIRNILKLVPTLLVLGFFFGCGDASKGQTRFTNTDITGADFARDFDLTSHRGGRVSLTDFKGKVVIVDRLEHDDGVGISQDLLDVVSDLLELLVVRAVGRGRLRHPRGRQPTDGDTHLLAG